MEQLVAVYGSLRKGLGNHPVMGDSKLIGATEVKGFVMHSLGGFPVIYRAEEENTIIVEVYSVSEEQLVGPIDSLENHPHWYKRELISTEYGDAWVYIMTDDRYRGYEQVVDGDWYQFRNGSSFSYYS